jgi:predicted nucleic acid-binding protein
VDTSALVKRYVDEVGSDWLRALAAPDQNALLFISRMTIVEVISAFARRLREGSLDREEFVAAKAAFRGDCLDEYQVMPPTLTVVNLACALLERHLLRAYDATHLATALGAQQFLSSQSHLSLTFLSADDRLNRAAAAEGLAVDNPNQHPSVERQT